MSIGIELSTEEEVRAKITSRLEGRAHWIFLVKPSGGWLLEKMEETFYAKGESAADFEVYMGAFGEAAGAIAVTHKRRMSHGQLMDLLASECDVNFPRESSPEADIMVLADGATLDEQTVVLVAFAQWIKG